jgi:peptidoglycan/LPS O-acetylase OafA/YrhL
MKPRLLFLDVIRIIAIMLIVIFHVGLDKTGWWSFNYLFLGVVITLGQIGVYLFIFISGASLAYSYPSERVFKNLKTFYSQRLLRIYPAYWVSMAIPIIITPTVLEQVNRWNIIPIITGFTAFFGMAAVSIDPVYWFIGLIVSLYLVYPLLIKFIEWKPAAAMFVMILISGSSLFLLVHFNLLGAATDTGVTHWFPLCNLAIFGAGIYCIKTGLYPKIKSRFSLIPYFAGLSFFVFLYHFPLMPISGVSIFVYIVIVVGISIVAMHFDNHVRKKINEFYPLITKKFRCLVNVCEPKILS